MQIENGNRKLSALPSAALGGASAVVSAALLLLVCSALLLKTRDPAAHSGVGLFILLFCCMTGGFIGGKCTDEAPFLSGLAGGAMFISVVTVVALIVPGKISWGLLPAAAGAATLGAFLGSIRRDKSTYPAFEDGYR